MGLTKEEQFIFEYKALINKYNVSLNIRTWSNEWGSNIDVAFKENGNYCQIHYIPDAEINKRGYCGMGS